MSSSLPPNYRPSEDEEFMSPLQVEYFRQKLLRWRASLVAELTDTLQHLKEESLLKPDLTDRAALEVERTIELRTRARERRLISKIDAALHRIEHGTYGYCEEQTSRSASAGSRRARSPPSASRRRSGTSGWSAPTATIDCRCGRPETSLEPRAKAGAHNLKQNKNKTVA